MDERWLTSLTDPFREELLAAGGNQSERIHEVGEPLRGDPAFDPDEIARLANVLRLPTDTRFSHPFLERVVRVGLAHINATFLGDHPKYGTGVYAQEIHDGFPPTIIATVDALTLWRRADRAEQLFGYWLDHFVLEDGAINYYGPSLSEYGQLLTTARRLMDRGGTEEWFREHEASLQRLASHVHSLLRQHGEVELVRGGPEADESNRQATYFHNNAWLARGIDDWATLLQRRGRDTKTSEHLRREASQLRRSLLDALHGTWPEEPGAWWLRPMLEEDRGGYWERPEGHVTANRLGSYTNYRYWPELLSSGVLPRKLMLRVVNARLYGGGQFCGMTRFSDHLDDWPLMEHMEGLWQLGMFEDYRLCLWGHVCRHQAEGHLTAYEQVTLSSGHKAADYCLPCQLVAVRALGKRIV